MAEVTKADWHKAFSAVEKELIAEGYTCDDLCPVGKQCIACLTSMKLRARLLGDEA